MELKQPSNVLALHLRGLLIAPYGIETQIERTMALHAPSTNRTLWN